MVRAAVTADTLRFLGLARRAGAVASGVDAVRRALDRGEAHLVLTAEDASRVQLRKIGPRPGRPGIPTAVVGDRAALGAAVGRGPVSAVAVTGATFAAELKDRLAAPALADELEG